jgi:alkylation response protein AidB-like acyl-CoA dehydrogenase
VQTSLSTADQAFLDEVRAFVDAHWRPPDGFDGRRAEGFAPHERAWTQALVARGWSVPGWPVEQGGAGWPARWLYLWRRELAQAGAPGLDECGVEWAGPALWSWGDAAQQARFLAAIREGRERWCLGLVEPEAGSDHGATRTRAVGAADAYVVDGAKAWVAGAERARWMLALARTGGADCEPDAALSLLVIDLEAPGVSVRPVRMLGDLPGMATVAFAGVRVPLDAARGCGGRRPGHGARTRAARRRVVRAGRRAQCAGAETGGSGRRIAGRRGSAQRRPRLRAQARGTRRGPGRARSPRTAARVAAFR